MTILDTDPAAGLRVDIIDAVATVILALPDRLNCQSPAMWEELARVRRELAGNVRVVVLRGDGRAFSAGLDREIVAGGRLLALADVPVEQASAQIAAWQDAFDWNSDPAVTTIAAVHGHAVGGGFQLALGADIRIVADNVQFCMAEPTLGIVPDLGGTKRLVDLVGVSRATEICLTGRRVGAEEALRLGLASHVVPLDGLDAAVRSTVDALLAIDRGVAAETKALLMSAPSRSQADQQRAEREAQYRRLRTLAGHADD